MKTKTKPSFICPIEATWGDYNSEYRKKPSGVQALGSQKDHRCLYKKLYAQSTYLYFYSAVMHKFLIRKPLSVFEICSLTALHRAVTALLLCTWNKLKPLGKCALFRTNKRQTKLSEFKTLIPAVLEVKIHMTPTSCLYF